MPVRVVESKQNTRLKALRKALAAPGQGAQTLVGIEGPRMIEEALRAGLQLNTIFVAQGSERLLDSLRLPASTEVLQLPRSLLDSALATETPQPIAALVEPPHWTWKDALNRNQRNSLIIVLAGIQDPGNLGTILRSAEAFGASGVVSLPGTVSAWNSKAVRASAGSVFRVPLLVAAEKKCFEQLRESGTRILATTARDAQPANLIEMSGPVALLIGNEGNGVPDHLLDRADARITIPCPGPVESLNAAMAATVLLYEAAQQRARSADDSAPHQTLRRPTRSGR